MKLFTVLCTLISFGLLSTVALQAAERDGEWTILASYSIPGKASGLAWDGTYLYFGIYGSNGENVYRFNPSTATYALQFSNPAIGDSYGMTFDGENLWIIDRDGSPAYAMELSLSGDILSQFDLPDQYMSGIAWDEGDFWVATYYPDPGTVYKVDGSGNVLQQFTPPDDQPWDLAMHGDDLWIVDYFAHMIHKVDQDGNVLESHEAEDQRPAGIVFDGTYVWYVDGSLGGNSTLYKVDPAGAGTAVINIPVTSHHFGNVTVGNTATWEMLVENNGNADLLVEDIELPAALPVSANVGFPVVIPEGESAVIPLVYAPVETGVLNGEGVVLSNDPINGSIAIDMSGYALAEGPHIFQPASSYSYGSIRSGASKRWMMTVQNFGDSGLTLDDISIDDPNFYIGDLVSLPITLAPLGMVTFDVWFWPSSGGDHEAVLSIISNDPVQNPFEVGLMGTAVEDSYPIGTPLWQYTISGSYDNSPKAIGHIPDITGDGIPDVVVCSEDNYIRAFNGNASGLGQVLWEREIYSGSLYQQNALANAGDISEDGYEDIVVGTAWGDRSIIAISSKTGDILWKHQTNNYGSGGWVYQVDSRFDYNGDGFPDVLAASGNDTDNTGPRRVYCLDGKTGEPIWETFIGSAAYAVMGIHDVNGDGQPDVVAGATSPDGSHGRVIAINGATGQILWTFNTSGTAVFALEALDDINGDGVPDIIAGSFNGNLYLLDATDGQVIDQGYLGNNLILQLFRLDDINEDGYADIYPTHSGTAAMAIDGTTGNAIWTQPLADKPWNASPMPDITGNGKQDIAVGTLFANNYVYFLNGEDGSELFAALFNEPVDALNVIPDITGDHSWEMVAGGRDGKVVCFSGGEDSPVSLPENHVKAQHSFTSSAHPNPFTSLTSIGFDVPEQGKVMLKIYNLNGTVIWEASGVFGEGQHAFDWHGKDASGNKQIQGLYIYELHYQERLSRGRLILLD